MKIALATLAFVLAACSSTHRGASVTAPSGATSSGRVVAISSVADPSTDGATSPDNQSNGQNGPQQVTVPAQVSLDHPSIAAQLDQAPVTVTIADRQVRNVLAVPITA
jgi:hypothetical protein